MCTSPIVSQVVDVIAGLDPAGMIFVAFTDQGIRYGLYGNAKEPCRTSKALIQVISDLQTE